MARPLPGKWHIVGAYEVGTGHQRMTPARGCDDFCSWRLLPQNALALAVADGAGSASQSAIGASAAAQAALSEIERLLSGHATPQSEGDWQAALQQTLQIARDGVRSRVAEGFTQSDYATTLLLVTVTDLWVAALHIGDGASVIRRAGGAIAVLTWPDNGEYANSTTFITSPDFGRHTRTVVLPREDIDGVALLTDGLEMIALDFEQHQPHPGFFQGFFTFAAGSGPEEAKQIALQEFLQSERVNERTDDDKTLVLAVLG